MQLMYDLNGTDRCQLLLWNLMSISYITDLVLVHKSSHSFYLIQAVFLSFNIIAQSYSKWKYCMFPLNELNEQLNTQPHHLYIQTSVDMT